MPSIFKPNFIHSSLSMFIAIGLSACGGDKDKKDDVSANKAGRGWVEKPKDDKIEISFPEAEAGAQFILMPFTIGKLASVNGSTDETFTYTMSTSTAGGGGFLELKPKNNLNLNFAFGNSDTFDREHAMRMLMNRFDSTKGLEQGDEFWQLAAKIDATGTQSQHQSRGFLDGAFNIAQPSSMTAFYQAYAQMPARMPLTATAGTCPTDSIPIPGATTPYELDENAIDKTDYCVAYAHNPITESDKDAVDNLITTIVKRYKEVIYKDDLTGAADFAFKPLVVVIDFTDAAAWPAAQSGLVGAYNSDVSTTQKMPVLYMAADLKKNSKLKDRSAAELKSIWYSTLAHEMHHAIVDFVRTKRASGEREIAVLDEGMAHLMEDVFGHGDVNFKEYPGAFLSTFGYGSNPFLGKEADANVAEVRGSAQTLLYYLASQKGGLTYTDGELTGGDGLTFLANVVKETTANGTKNLATKFDADWSETIGNYLGSLVLDGTDIKNIQDKFNAQDPVTNIKDLAGSNKATFGMSFNNFGGVTEKFEDIKSSQTLESQLEISDLHYYHTKPVLFTLSDPGTTVTMNADAEGSAVSIVRIK